VMTINCVSGRKVRYARVENRDPELRAARYLSVNLGVGTWIGGE
jgi:hypothetical protein